MAVAMRTSQLPPSTPAPAPPAPGQSTQPQSAPANWLSLHRADGGRVADGRSTPVGLGGPVAAARATAKEATEPVHRPGESARHLGRRRRRRLWLGSG